MYLPLYAHPGISRALTLCRYYTWPFRYTLSYISLYTHDRSVAEILLFATYKGILRVRKINCAQNHNSNIDWIQVYLFPSPSLFLWNIYRDSSLQASCYLFPLCHPSPLILPPAPTHTPSVLQSQWNSFSSTHIDTYYPVGFLLLLFNFWPHHAACSPARDQIQIPCIGSMKS